MQFRNRGKTVFLTTHYMEEADELVDRVAFIRNGNIAALDTPFNLKLRYGSNELVVKSLEDNSIKEYFLSLKDPTLGTQIDALSRKGKVLTLHTQEASLDEVFIQLTGAKL